MAFVRCNGGAKKPNNLQFPPKDGWVGSGTAANISISDSQLSCGDMSSGQYADFTKPFDASNANRTITANFVCGASTRQVFIYIDGTQAFYDTISANTSRLFSLQLTPGSHSVIFRIINGGWSSNGGGAFTLISCA